MYNGAKHFYCLQRIEKNKNHREIAVMKTESKTQKTLGQVKNKSPF